MGQTQTASDHIARHRVLDNPVDCTFGNQGEVQEDDEKGQQAEAQQACGAIRHEWEAREEGPTERETVVGRTSARAEAEEARKMAMVDHGPIRLTSLQVGSSV